MLRESGKEKSFSQDEIGKLMDFVLEVEGFIGAVERKGVPFREFVAEKKDNLYPRYQVSLRDKFLYVHTDEELVSFKVEHDATQKLIHEETLASIPPEEVTEEMKTFVAKPLVCIELYDPSKLVSLSEKLSTFKLHLEQYVMATGPLFELIEEGNKVTPLHTLHEVIDAIRANGRKGVEVQRYKGLGEMNADQLWETTMDPQVRTLVQVTIPDAIGADRMFSMLMGEVVEPRRAFIEQHALSVKNLDV